ncbi:galactokinase [Candidatus Poribacteria bacterium]|nr:galactokinase [Candidatus Poribacteria bacterium]
MTSLHIRQQFQHRFGSLPQRIAHAPGRVNLIGEHTDYNDGFVLPVAIDQYVSIAARSRSDRRVVLYALDFDQTCEFSLGDIRPSTGSDTWSNYPKGVAYFLQQANQPIIGLEGVISGDVPLASGLGSSAALEVASALAFLNAGISPHPLPLSPAVPRGRPASRGVRGEGRRPQMSQSELALLCQRAENQFAGVNCGIMDGTISILGKADHALFLDCRTLHYELVPLNLGEVQIIVCNTKVKRELASSEYNKRRATCEEGVEILKQWLPSISSLRDVSLSDFKKYETFLPPLTQKRCRYVIQENERALGAVEALKAGNLQAFGRLMNASHIGLRDDYEVSCLELDAMVEIAWAHHGVVGARMTGAGFGGCTVNLVRRDAVASLTAHIQTEYPRRTGIEPEIYICNVGDGAYIET